MPAHCPTPARQGALALALAAACMLATPAHAAEAVFFGPTAYLSTDDIPLGFYANDTPTYLADMETAFGHAGNYLNGNTLSGGLFSGGLRSGCLATSTNGCVGLSVDADDGAVNGTAFGFALSQAGESSVSVVAGELPTAFGLVITGGNPFATVTFRAFDAQGQSLGSVSYAGSVLRNGTAGHRFVGVQFAGGIQRVTVNAATSVAFDHVQYGAMPSAVPEPGTWALMLGGVGLLGWLSGRRRAI